MRLSFRFNAIADVPFKICQEIKFRVAQNLFKQVGRNMRGKKMFIRSFVPPFRSKSEKSRSGKKVSKLAKSKMKRLSNLLLIAGNINDDHVDVEDDDAGLIFCPGLISLPPLIIPFTFPLENLRMK